MPEYEEWQRRKVQTSHLAQFAGVGKKLVWDVEKMQCTNVPEINRYVRRTYRAGWEVEG